MNHMDELLDQTTIEFSNHLDVKELEGTFFSYLESKAPCNIDYTVWFQGHVRHPRAGEGDSEEIRERYPIKLTASIHRLIGTCMSSAEFETTFNGDFAEGIKFRIIPGYELKEHPEGWLELIEDIRKRTLEYFSQRIEEHQ